MRTTLDGVLRTVLDRLPDGLLIEAGDAIIYLNDAYAQSLGYRSARDLIGATVLDIADEEDSERLRWYGRCREEGKPAPYRYTFRARRRDRSIVTFDASISSVWWRGQFLITTVTREIVSPAEPRSAPIASGLKPLSAREYEVLSHLLAGRRSKEIARLLDISEKTVGTLRSRAYHKLALRSDLDLFRYAADNGLLNDRTAREILSPADISSSR